jgi:hypothetical protein
MAEDRPSPQGDTSRPIDHGLSEGKSMGFAPTGALGPQSFPIGGLAPMDATTTSAAGDGPSASASASGSASGTSSGE